MLGAVIKLFANEDGLTAIEYGLAAAMLMALAGQLANQFILGQ